jgi:hypothetical protein
VRKRKREEEAITSCKRNGSLYFYYRLYQEHENLKNRLTNVKPTMNVNIPGQYDNLAEKLSKRRQTSYHNQ